MIMQPRSLSARLLATFVALFAVLTIVVIWLSMSSTRLLLETVEQSFNHGLASRLATGHLSEIRPSLNKPAVELAIDRLMVVNPRLEIYILDLSGNIVAYSAPEGRVQLKRVDVVPVRAFLSHSRLPIRGTDPRNPGLPRVFSAAPVEFGDGTKGYLYVILAGDAYNSVLDMLATSHMARTSLTLMLSSMLVVGIIGVICFASLTRRLRSISGALKEFESSDFREPPMLKELEGRNSHDDEVSAIAAALGQMSSRISELLASLDVADRQRRDFLANIAHDLRTPLAVLGGYLETLSMKVQDEKLRNFCEEAYSQYHRIAGQVDAIFELAKFEAPTYTLQSEQFSLDELVQDNVKKFDMMARSRTLLLSVKRSAEPVFVRGNIELIERALDNLVGNAIKFSSEGGRVDIAIEALPDEARVGICDTGPGIPGEDLERIFEPFFRSSRVSESDGQGTGLGLAIALRIAQLHGGSIRATNLPAGGAMFVLSLPLAAD